MPRISKRRFDASARRARVIRHLPYKTGLVVSFAGGSVREFGPRCPDVRSLFQTCISCFCFAVRVLEDGVPIRLPVSLELS